MNRAGKAHWLTIAGIASIFLVLGLFFFGKDPVATTSFDFMKALAKGNVDRLVELSAFPDGSKEDLKKKWEFAVHEAGPHYRFYWRVDSVSRTAPDAAVAHLTIIRNFDQEGSDEKFELPVTKTDEGWKVEVRAINRKLYPALPR